MINGAKRLRELLAQPGVLLCPGTFDCVSAKVAERAGFPVLSISGAALAASVLGYPDVGLPTMPEVLNQARNIARCVEVPVTVDADTGYGNALNAMRATREFEAAGLAGMMIEDQVFPKRCGHFEGKKVIPAEEMVIKLQAVCEARRNGDFVIIARTDARAIHGIDEAIRRALMYCEAGADMIFVEAMMDVDEMWKVAKAIPKPLKANMNDGGKTPPVHYNELYEMGYKLINYSGMLQRTAIRAMMDVAEILKREGTTSSAYPEKICDMTERSELLGLAKFYALEERLYGKFLETEGSWRKELDERSSVQSRETQEIPI
ncbi:MAG: isocitrate lyase/PEP mutase family protein [Proteobacteria bacterium]|nr:isocitrate lyase/PEP mutase family protein [Pseudomonadota bacterium]MBU2227590.1 isocitrate lyase/PEP mutase family protein [Pseudomonadota bacterium]MBU2261143.1 isocitrate lyase/PEP mutase family protein [Pseudomonadota bacterium]